jgi:hypothetical protein
MVERQDTPSFSQGTFFGGWNQRRHAIDAYDTTSHGQVLGGV